MTVLTLRHSLQIKKTEQKRYLYLTSKKKRNVDIVQLFTNWTLPNCNQTIWTQYECSRGKFMFTGNVLRCDTMRNHHHPHMTLMAKLFRPKTCQKMNPGHLDIHSGTQLDKLLQRRIDDYNANGPGRSVGYHLSNSTTIQLFKVKSSASSWPLGYLEHVCSMSHCRTTLSKPVLSVKGGLGHKETCFLDNCHAKSAYLMVLLQRIEEVFFILTCVVIAIISA